MQIKEVINEHNGILKDFEESYVISRLASLCHSVIKTPSVLVDGAFLTVTQLTISIVNNDTNQALHAGSIAIETTISVISLLALGILGLISPSAAITTGEKIIELIEIHGIFNQSKLQGTDHLPNWKKRIILPIAEFAKFPSAIIIGLGDILAAPLQNDVKANINQGWLNICDGFRAPIKGIDGIFNPESYILGIQ